MTIHCHFPSLGSLSRDALLEGLPAHRDTGEPFADDAVAFCEAAAGVFSSVPRDLGAAWAAAGFFFRKAAIARMRQDFSRTRAARGLVFHVTPGNVETQFVYSWLFSLLAGNTNVVRISSRLGQGALDVIARLSELDFPRIARTTRILSFGHDKAVVDALSLACDVRVVWGGDESIRQIRTSPLAPGAKEITFPDRFSVAAIDVAGFLAMNEAARRRTARAFALDVWVFDQMACSSPKALVWVGPEAEAKEASAPFFELVQAEIERSGARVALVTAMEKTRFAFGALADGRATTARRISNELEVVGASDLDRLRDARWGGGLVVELRASDMDAFERMLRPGDQTIAHACFASLDGLERVARRAGVCRVVPMGRALAFSRVWDGMDLLEEMTRIVVVEGQP